MSEAGLVTVRNLWLHCWHEVTMTHLYFSSVRLFCNFFAYKILFVLGRGFFLEPTLWPWLDFPLDLHQHPHLLPSLKPLTMMNVHALLPGSLSSLLRGYGAVRHCMTGNKMFAGRSWSPQPEMIAWLVFSRSYRPNIAQIIQVSRTED